MPKADAVGVAIVVIVVLVAVTLIALNSGVISMSSCAAAARTAHTPTGPAVVAAPPVMGLAETDPTPALEQDVNMMSASTVMSMEDVVQADKINMHARQNQDRRQLLDEMKPDQRQAKEFMAANQITNWAPGVSNIGQRIEDANMHMDVLRRPIADGVGNRAPFILFHPPPPRDLPEKAPEILSMGFGISERLSNVYLPNPGPEMMPTRMETDGAGNTYRAQAGRGNFMP